jgi:hypothetical protein
LKRLIYDANRQVRGYICDHNQKVYDITWKSDCPQCNSLSASVFESSMTSRLDREKSLSQLLLGDYI